MNNYMPVRWTTWKTDRFLEKFNLPRLKEEEREFMNKPLTSTEIKTD